MQRLEEQLDNLENKTLIQDMSLDYACHRMLFSVWRDEYRLWQLFIRR